MREEGRVVRGVCVCVCVCVCGRRGRNGVDGKGIVEEWEGCSILGTVG